MKFIIFPIFLVAVSGYMPPDITPEQAQPSTWRRFNSSELEIFLQGLPKSLVHLGTSADGKAVFVDTSASVTWQEARSKCKAMNLKLLQVLTRQQLDFVASAATSAEYWIGGRENRGSSNSITWDTLDGQTPAHYYSWGSYVESDIPYQLCLSFWTHESYRGWMSAIPCTNKRWYLCEA